MRCAPCPPPSSMTHHLIARAHCPVGCSTTSMPNTARGPCSGPAAAASSPVLPAVQGLSGLHVAAPTGQTTVLPSHMCCGTALSHELHRHAKQRYRSQVWVWLAASSPFLLPGFSGAGGRGGGDLQHVGHNDGWQAGGGGGEVRGQAGRQAGGGGRGEVRGQAGRWEGEEDSNSHTIEVAAFITL